MTGTPSSVPPTSSPLWPGAPGSGKPGIAEYGMRIADCTASATEPNPEPKTMATRGRRPSSLRATASVARRISSDAGWSIPQSAFRNPHSQEHPRQRRRQEVRERPGDHGAEAEARESVFPLRGEGPDTADLNPDRAHVGEAAQSEGGDGEGDRAEGRLHRAELRVGDEFVQRHAGAEQAADRAAVVPRHAHDPCDWCEDPTQHGLDALRKPCEVDAPARQHEVDAVNPAEQSVDERDDRDEADQRIVRLDS